MSVEDPMEEKPPVVKLSPRTTPLYYLLACIFTLSIGTACFLAGKWSVDKAALDQRGGTAKFELYTVTTESEAGLSSRHDVSSATGAAALSATTPATTTETGEWLFAEIISTPAIRQAVEDITTTTTDPDTTTENWSTTEEMTTETASTTTTGFTEETSTTWETETTSMPTTTDETTSWLPTETDATSTLETTSTDPTTTDPADIDRSSSASEIDSITARMITDDPTTVDWESTTFTTVVVETTATDETGETTTTEEYTTVPTTTTEQEPECVTEEVIIEVDTENPEHTTEQETPIPTTEDYDPVPGWLLNEEEDAETTTVRSRMPLPSFKNWYNTHSLLDVPWFRRRDQGSHRVTDPRILRRTLTDTKREVDDIVRLFARFLHDTDRLFPF